MSVSNEQKEKPKRRKPIKIVIRRLPPYLTWEELKEQLDPIPPTEYESFVPADLAFEPHAFSKCYLAFTSDEDVIDFSNRFNRYVFVDSRGFESAAVVELAIFGKIPKRKQSDVKSDNYCGEVEEEFEYKQFLDELEANRSCTYLTLEEQVRVVQQKDEQTKTGNHLQTPLTRFIVKKNDEKVKKTEEKRKQRSEERKRRQEKKGEDEKQRIGNVLEKVLLSFEPTARDQQFKYKDGPTNQPPSYKSAKKVYKESNPTKEPNLKKLPATAFRTKHTRGKLDKLIGAEHKETNENNEKETEQPIETNRGLTKYKKPRVTSMGNEAEASGTETTRGPSKFNKPSRVTAVSKEAGDKKKNKDRPDREIYRPSPRLRYGAGGIEGSQHEQSKDKS